MTKKYHIPLLAAATLGSIAISSQTAHAEENTNKISISAVSIEADAIELPVTAAFNFDLDNEIEVGNDLTGLDAVQIEWIDPVEEARKAEEARKVEEARLAEEKLQAELAAAQDTSTVTAAVETPATQTIDYSSPSGGVVDQIRASVVNGHNAYPVGQCTWGAKTLAPWVGSYWGDANQWIYSAQAEGKTISKTPAVGAVVCWTGGWAGHVAVVTHVESPTSIQVMESNYAGNQYIGNFRGWFNPQATSEGEVWYIYP